MSELMRKKCAAFIVLCHLLKKKKTRTVRRCWIKDLYKQREHEGGNRLLTIIGIDETNDHLKKFLHVSVEDFELFINLIGPKVEKQNSKFRESISVKEKLAITLRFLATGDSYVSLQYLFKISKQSISLIIPEVCKVLAESLKDYIKMPITGDEWLKVAQDFEHLWQFPNCLGALDGKHVALQAPFNSANEFINHKSLFSIVVFALVDANYNFLFVDIGYQDRISDGEVFKNTVLHRKIENHTLGLPSPKPLLGMQKEIPYVFIGDEAFPLTESIMKPYGGINRKGSNERIFDYRLSRARRVVENTFGIISSVFKVLRKPLLLSPKKAELVVMAIVCLHNYLKSSKTSSNRYISPGVLDSEEEGCLVEGSWRQSTNGLQNIVNIPHRATVHAQEIREEFTNYFTTTGTVSWQSNYA